jgi:hypothetical protein
MEEKNNHKEEAGDEEMKEEKEGKEEKDKINNNELSFDEEEKDKNDEQKNNEIHGDNMNINSSILNLQPFESGLNVVQDAKFNLFDRGKIEEENYHEGLCDYNIDDCFDDKNKETHNKYEDMILEKENNNKIETENENKNTSKICIELEEEEKEKNENKKKIKKSNQTPRVISKINTNQKNTNTNNEELLKKKKNEIPFAQYKTNIDFHNSKDDVNLYTYFMVFNEMERQIGKYIENDYLTEQEKINLTEKINRILYLNEKITDKDYEELEGYLKTDLGQKTFLLLLSTLRSNGKYEKAKIFIELIGKALNLILESAEKEANYDKAKNCLILSQTFFYYDINKEKIYIFIFIQDNKWIKGISFWREFIDLMINREVQKIGNLTDRKMNDVLLTQVLPFVNNMKDLHIDNKNIVKVIDEIIEKYHVKDEDIKDALFSLISSDKKVIEELRNEYKKNEN